MQHSHYFRCVPCIGLGPLYGNVAIQGPINNCYELFHDLLFFKITGFLCLLTGSVTCTFRLAAPVAGARSVGSLPRAPGYIRDIGSVLVAGGHGILSGRPASLFCSDQRLYGEGVRLDAERARGAPLLCHFSPSRDRGTKGGIRRHELAGSKKSSTHTVA